MNGSMNQAILSLVITTLAMSLFSIKYVIAHRDVSLILSDSSTLQMSITTCYVISIYITVRGKVKYINKYIIGLKKICKNAKKSNYFLMKLGYN